MTRNLRSCCGSRQLSVAACAALFVTLLAAPAHGDSITITNGAITLRAWQSDDENFYSLIGEQFRLSGETREGYSSPSLLEGAGDQTFNLSQRLVVTESDWHRVTLMFHRADLSRTDVRLEYAVTIPDMTVDLRPIKNDSRLTGSATAPFIFSGLLQASAVDTKVPLVTLPLTGQGTASFTKFGFPTELHLTFESTNPVPEPSTLLLFATGAAAAGRRFWKRRGEQGNRHSR